MRITGILQLGLSTLTFYNYALNLQINFAA